MKRFLFSCLLLIACSGLFGQSLYTKTFGTSDKPAIIFLHGGPGYNCANFEATTAQQLADSGFFVIVYDRRGEGRSVDTTAYFNLRQTYDDLLGIYGQFSLNKATLIGHSFGGVVALAFAAKYAEQVNAIVLVSAPLAMQETFKTILASSKKIYLANKDTTNLNYIAEIEKMDTSSIMYSSYCFGHAMQNHFYTPKHPTEKAKALYAQLAADTVLGKYAQQMTMQAPMGFWKNEKYTTRDLTPNVPYLLKNHVKIFALYGKDDGLFSPQQVKKVTDLLGAPNVKYLDNCSHNVFIDQQPTFIAALKGWLK